MHDKEAQVQQLADKVLQEINTNPKLVRTKNTINRVGYGTQLDTLMAFIRTLPAESIQELQSGNEENVAKFANAISQSMETQIGNIIDDSGKQYDATARGLAIAHFESNHKQDFVNNPISLGRGIANALENENKKLNHDTLQAQLNTVIISTKNPKELEIIRGLTIGMIKEFSNNKPYKDIVDKTNQLPKALTVAILKAASELAQKPEYQDLDREGAIKVGKKVGEVARDSKNLNPQKLQFEIVYKEPSEELPKEQSMLAKMFSSSSATEIVEKKGMKAFPFEVVSDVEIKDNIIASATSSKRVDKALGSGHSASSSSLQGRLYQSPNTAAIAAAHTAATDSVTHAPRVTFEAQNTEQLGSPILQNVSAGHPSSLAVNKGNIPTTDPSDQVQTAILNPAMKALTVTEVSDNKLQNPAELVQSQIANVVPSAQQTQQQQQQASGGRPNIAPPGRPGTDSHQKWTDLLEAKKNLEHEKQQGGDRGGRK